MNTSTTHTLHMFDRKSDGEKTSVLRKKGLVPSSVFGEGGYTNLISISEKELYSIVAVGADSALLYLTSEGSENVPVLIEEIQSHPVTGKALHVSFKRVNLKEKITAEVSIETVGEADIRDATVVQVRDVVEVEALPADIPEKITIDISKLTEIGQTLLITDAEYDRSVVKVLLSEEEALEPFVVVQEVKEEVEPEVVEEVAEGEAEATTETEGDAAAEEKAE